MNEVRSGSTGGAADPNNPFGYPMEDVEAGKLMAILGYLIPILFIVPLIQKDNHFSLFHAKQVLLLIFGYVASSIVAAITCGVGSILYIPCLVWQIIGLVFAIQGQYKPLPLVGNLAENWFKGIQKETK